MSEHDPSRGGETGPRPSVQFDVTDIEAISSLTASAEVHTIANEVQPPIPLDELYINVEGTEEPDGPYVITSHLLFRVPGQHVRLFAAGFAQMMGGIEYQPDKFLLISESQRQYRLSVHPEQTVVVLETAGKVDEETGESDFTDQLQVDEDEFQPALRDFLKTSEMMLVNLFNAAGHHDARLRVTLSPPMSSCEDDDDEPLPPYMIRPKKRFSDLAGMDEIQNQLLDIVDAMRHPEIMEAYLAERHHGIFLFGPAGTGKTSLAEAVAAEIKADMRIVRSSDIYGMYMGQSERNFQTIIDEARAVTRPFVLCFDEVDAIIRTDGGSAYAAVAGLFKQQIGRLCEENKNVILIATSNKQPNEIDDALFRAGRFDAHLYVPLPDEQGRAAIFATFAYSHEERAGRRVFAAHQLDYEQLARATEDLSGADITEVMRGAITAKALTEIRTKQAPEPFTTQQLLNAIQAFRRKKS